MILPGFSYRAEMNGVVENELCPVMICFTDKKPIINKDEVESIQWINWQEFINDMKKNPGKYSPWCKEETKLLEKNAKLQRLYKEFVK